MAEEISQCLRENATLREIVAELTDVIAELSEPEIQHLLLVHTLEHEATGHGRVIDAARARATPCKCFGYEDEEYCWSPGVLGLMSSKKNPEQVTEFCTLGKESAGVGVKGRFREIKSAIGEAHEEWEAKGGGLPGWWESVAEKLSEKGVEL